MTAEIIRKKHMEIATFSTLSEWLNLQEWVKERLKILFSKHFKGGITSQDLRNWSFNWWSGFWPDNLQKRLEDIALSSIQDDDRWYNAIILLLAYNKSKLSHNT